MAEIGESEEAYQGSLSCVAIILSWAHFLRTSCYRMCTCGIKSNYMSYTESSTRSNYLTRWILFFLASQDPHCSPVLWQMRGYDCSCLVRVDVNAWHQILPVMKIHWSPIHMKVNLSFYTGWSSEKYAGIIWKNNVDQF